jgi:hypothetical protein
LALFAGAHTDFFAVEGGRIWVRRVLARCLVKETKMLFLCWLAYSALFNNVFEAINLLLIIFYYKYVAEREVPGKALAPLQNTEFWL